MTEWAKRICGHSWVTERYLRLKYRKKFNIFLKNFKYIFFNSNAGLFSKSSINLPWGHEKSHKNLGPIGSAVLTFYKQTDTQTSKEYIHIKSRFNNIFYQEEVRMLEESRREDSMLADEDEEARLDNNVDALQIVEER